jgi:hypothetical protein
MKKVITMLGSLMIIAGLKAQKDPVIKKETTPASTVSWDSLKSKPALPGKQLSSKTVATKINPVDSSRNGVIPKLNPVVKPEKLSPAALPDKQSPVAKPSKQ